MLFVSVPEITLLLHKADPWVCAFPLANTCATLQLNFEDAEGQDPPVNFTDSWMALAERSHLTGKH